LRCEICGKIAPENHREACGDSIPINRPPDPRGPGTEFGKLTAILGLKEKAGCKCGAIANEMNRAGPAGCRERREHFVEALKANYDANYNWLDLVAAAGRSNKPAAVALVKRIATISTHKAIERLFDFAVELAEQVDEAIRRAKEKH
jgi:hypothetical protein